MRDLFILHSSANAAFSGSKLREALAAQAGYERARSLRDTVLWVVVVLGAPVWLAAARPDWMSPTSRRLTLTLWLVAAVGLVLALVSERSWRRRCVEVVSGRRENQPPASADRSAL
jgi:peptidoglycan/LPS O-acetylase OafA/YrhL